MSDPKQAGAAAEEQMLLLVYRMRDRLMQQHEYSEQLATEVATLCVETVRDEYGGERLYVPAMSKLSRDAAIREELRTGNAGEVARRWNISERRVYQIARRRG
jgi:Mor family transcriptional regulator